MAGILDILGNAQTVPRDPAYNYGGLLPFRKPKAGGPAEWGLLYSDAVAGLLDAFTAPKRAMQGVPVDMRDAMGVGMGLLGANAAVSPLMKAGGPGTLNAMVFHGSPHRFAPEPDAPLGRFRSDKIGTGEGAQAYGYGHYLADSPGVAKSYRENLSRRNAGNSLNDRVDAISVDGAPLLERFKVELDPDFASIVEAGDSKAALSHAKARSDRWGELQRDESYQFRDYAANKAREWSKLVDALQSGADIASTAKGSMYSVDLADEAIPRMLDWDKPLSEQPWVLSRIKPLTEDSGISADMLGRMKGRDLMAQDGPMASWFGTNRTPMSFAEGLRQEGIPGIRYLDAGSRPKYSVATLEDNIFNVKDILRGLQNKTGPQADSSRRFHADNLQRWEKLLEETKAMPKSYNYVVFPGNEGLLKILSRE